jgi:hypothetical protein
LRKAALRYKSFVERRAEREAEKSRYPRSQQRREMFFARLTAVLAASVCVVSLSFAQQGATDGGRGNARFVPAGSFRAGQRVAGGFRADLIVLHRLAGSLDGAVAYMSGSGAGASCHYLVGKDGDVVQMVKEKDVAFHVKGFNQRAYCVEFEGFQNEPLTPAQIAKGREIVQGLIQDKRIQKIVTHGDLAQGRESVGSDEDFRAIAE